MNLLAIDISEDLSYGISFDYNYENHSVNSTSLSDIEYLNKGIFNGDADNFKLFLDLAYSISEGNKLVLSLGYSNRDLLSNFYEKELINLDSSAINATLNNEINFKSKAFVLKLSYLYEFPSSIGLGTSLLYSINLNDSYSYKQVLDLPADRGYFLETGTRLRNEQNGNLANFTSSNLSANVFIYKEFPLEINYKLVAIPKFGLEHSLLYLDEKSAWTFYSFYFSISILFN